MSDNFSVSDSAAIKISHLIATEPGASLFRVAVNGGGCSGFQYDFGSKKMVRALRWMQSPCPF
jgi:Fe-S cluster assembly iron-binding protein IscA